MSIRSICSYLFTNHQRNSYLTSFLIYVTCLCRQNRDVSYKKVIDISARGKRIYRSMPMISLLQSLFLSLSKGSTPSVYYPCESLSQPVILLSCRTTTRTMGVVYLPGLFMRDNLSLLQRPNAVLARPPVKHVGNLVTASSCRTSRPSRLTEARTWR